MTPGAAAPGDFDFPLALHAWLIPRSPLEVVAAASALLAGLFVVVGVGNTQGDSRRAWFQRSRVKAFLLLLSGGGGLLLVDLKGLTDDPGVDKSRVAGIFTLWAALAVFGMLAAGTLLVFVETALYATRHQAFRRRLLDLPTTFVVQGWDASRRLRDDIFAAIDARRDGTQDGDPARAETLGILAQIAMRLLRDIGRADAAQRALMADEVFTAIGNVVRRRGGEAPPRVWLNYLALRPIADVPAARRGDILFTFGDPARYSHVLVLRRRHNGMGEEPLGRPILIPVDGPGAGPDRLLPGAPQLVHGLEYVVLPTRHLSFPPGVPAATRTRISAFFRALPSQSVLSLRLSVGGAVVGVLNIESSLPNLLGMGDDSVQEVLTVVKPFATLLAYVVEQDENVRPV